MRSGLPKVLHRIGGRTLLAHVLDAAIKAGGGEIAVVVGPDHDAVAAEAARDCAQGQDFRAKRNGAAPRMRCWRRARRSLRDKPDDILVMFADTPLVRAETLGAIARGARAMARRWRCSVSGRRSRRLRAAAHARRRIAGDPRGARRERRRSAKSRFCNGGLMALAGKRALAILDRIRQRQCQGRILSDRCGCHRPRYGLEGGRDRNRGGRRARHQHQGAARRKPKPFCSSACAPPRSMPASP